MAEAVTNGSTTEVKPSPWFFTWMNEFRLGDGNASILQRWKGLVSFADNADHDDIEALVRLALASRQSAQLDRLNAFQEAFRTDDPAFSVASNSRELQVLAACCLIHITQTTASDMAVVAALAVATACVDGQRKVTLPGDIRQLANDALRAVSIGTARRPGLPPQTGQQYKAIFETAVQKLRNQQDWNGTIDALTQAGSMTTATINQIQTRTLAALRALETRLNQQDEELQMLWWLIGDRSEELDCAFEAVPADIRPLVLGNELAGHTLLPPGPPSVRALLSRAKLGGKGKVGLVAAIAGCSEDWLKNLVVSQHTSPVTQPIHFAILRQLETGPGTDWVAGWAAATDLPREIAFSPLTLAELFYRERLLTHLYV